MGAMKVKFTDRTERYNSRHRKDELDHSYKTITKEFETIVDCRTYSTDRMAYCCIWINHKKLYKSGSGSAGGYGYDRESAAVADALYNAGIDINNISGRGGSAVEQAIMAITKKLLGQKQFGLIISHP